MRIFRGRDPLTKKRTFENKTVHGTKKDAQGWLHRRLAEIETGRGVKPSHEPVETFLANWLKTAAKAKVRERTHNDYGRLLKRYVFPAIGSIRLSDLTPAHVQQVYNDMTGRGLGPRTVRYVHAVLSAAFTQAVDWRILDWNPATRLILPRQDRKEMKALTAEEAQRFLRAAESDRWYALWVLLLTSGLLPGEAMGLKWPDFDGTSVCVRRVLVPGYKGVWSLEEPKTKRSARTVVLPEIAVRAIKSHKARQNEDKLQAGPNYNDQGFVFAGPTGGPLNVRSLVAAHFERSLKAAGLPHIRLYDLRHTAATLLLAAGESVKLVAERLGHSTTALTLDVYGHVMPGMQERAAQRLDKLLGDGTRRQTV